MTRISIIPIILVLFLFLAIDGLPEARTCRVSLIPNGTGLTSFSCNTCHTNGGGSPLNAFGQDVEALVGVGDCVTEFWDVALAEIDSDGDGYSNGLELLDPQGSWQAGDPQPGDPALLSNPGDPNSIPPAQEETPTPSATTSPTPTMTPGTPTATPTMEFTPTVTPTPLHIDIGLEPVADGFTSPVVIANAGDATGRLFIADQDGQIYIVNQGSKLETPFLDVSDLLVVNDSNLGERGLLGLAFHPEYASNGRFFIYYSAPTTTAGMNHKSVVAEYQVSAADPNVADPTGTIILEIDQPESNHNGGQLAFGPDGMLYIGLGDGGGAGDNHGTIGNGQDITTPLGAILRIDVSTPGSYSVPPDNPFVGVEGVDEIWAYGLRNPWRFSFDPQTERLFCGDVGQNDYEEIDLIEKGANYGWRVLEGFQCFNPPSNCDRSGKVNPIAAYDHTLGISVTGGYVYRGIRAPELTGKYIFGDYSEPGYTGGGLMFYLDETSPGNFEMGQLNGFNPDLRIFIQAFGVDEEGEIYVAFRDSTFPTIDNGAIAKIVSLNPPIPLPQDINENGQVDQSDLLLLLSGWKMGTPNVDITNDNETNFNDLFFFGEGWAVEGWLEN